MTEFLLHIFNRIISRLSVSRSRVAINFVNLPFDPSADAHFDKLSAPQGAKLRGRLGMSDYYHDKHK